MPRHAAHPADPSTAPDADEELTLDAGRRRTRAGLAVGAIGVALLGVGMPAAHAATTADVAGPRPDPAARLAALPPALPTRPGGTGTTDAISDVWGRGAGDPPRRVR